MKPKFEYDSDTKAIYIKVKKGRHGYTKDYDYDLEGKSRFTLIADYSKTGELLGIEILL